MPTKKTMLGQGIVLAAIVFTISPLIAFAADTIGASVSAPGERLQAIGKLFSSIATAPTLSAIRFSLLQALLSTILALGVGLPGAFFVAKYQFRGRRLFLALSAVPFCLPSILVILAFILYYGKNGWFTAATAALGLAGGNSAGFLYSLWGLVFIHAFYNFPIVIQNVGSVWARLPRSREEAARTLGAGKLKAFFSGSLPYLLPSILQSASLIFLFCFFSFTIVLVFGSLSGTTLEVDIYRAIRFTNDKERALALSLVQTAIALIVVGIFTYFDGKNATLAKDFGNVPPRKHPGASARVFITLYQLLLAVFFIGPLFALAAEAFSVRISLAGGTHLGFDNFARLLAGRDAPLPRATLNSLLIGGAAAILATAMGSAIASISHYSGRNDSPPGGQRAHRGSSWITALPLAISPAIVAIGWSTLLHTSDALVIIIGQTAIAWPFVARSLGAAFGALDKSKNEAARTLGSSPLHAVVHVDFAAMAPSIASAAGFAFSITLGDVNIPLVLGSGKFETLPLLLYRLTSSYRFNEACAVGLVLALFTGLAFFLKEKSNDAS